MHGMRWDIVCRIVDNYGDAGVCWRLARQLAAEHRLDVTLWLDRLATLAHLEPSLDPTRSVQASAGVTVRRLVDAAPAPALPGVVVEGFGCGLPAPWLDAMANAAKPPLWINLEYLSAEPWVDSVHGLASAHPRLPLTRYFWFPGFTARTGGLIREARLFDHRDAAQSCGRGDASSLGIVLFCYANRALAALFDAWAEADEAITCTVPEGVATAALDAWLHGDVPRAGQSVARGRLRLDVVPFRTQDAFDRMLWNADANFVRGEDSFVRAQWAARPFVWQPYQQAENAHRLKLDAFLSRYAAALDAETRAALTAFWRAFDDEDEAGVVATWPAFRASLPVLATHGRRWADDAAALPELTSGLVEFAQTRL